MIALFSFKITSFADDRSILIIMKSFNISIVFFSLILPAFYIGIYAQDQEVSDPRASKKVYGEGFDITAAKSGPELLQLYENLDAGDSSEVQFRGKVSSVCKVKGCWMELELTDGQEARVTFKDYGFFVPTDLVGREVVVKGQAHVDIISEEDRKHYAEDEGKTPEEISKLQGSQKSYSLVAVGVVVED